MQDAHFRSLPRVSVSFFVSVTCAKLTFANDKKKIIDKVLLLGSSKIRQSLGSAADYP